MRPNLSISLLVVLSMAPTARAEMAEWQLSLGASYRGIAYDGDPALALHAPGASFGAWYGLDDFWQIGGAIQAGVALPVGGDGLADPGALASMTAEARYVIDIVEWVPHLALGVGALWSGVGDDTLDVTVGVGLGIDYRPARDWSLGLTGRYDFVVSDFDGVSAAYLVTLVYSFYISDF